MILTGDCLDILPTLEPESVDSIVTDPPYGLSFMGKDWDHGVPGVPFWEAALRVAKPGVYMLAFGGTRTFHRLAVAIEDAGWEIRDVIMWVYGSGFPKSLDVSKAIDKAAGVDREDKFEGSFERHAGPTGNKKCDVCGKWLVSGSPCQCPRPQDKPQSDLAKQWEGWGTALKPAWEPIIVARKPIQGTVAENVLKYGTGGLNIDGCRVGIDPKADASQLRTMNRSKKSEKNGWGMNQTGSDTPEVVSANGRWPANLIHDGSDEVLALFPVGKSGDLNGCMRSKKTYYGEPTKEPLFYQGDSGSAARFFYCSKASRRDRNEGCEGLPLKIEKRTQDGGDDTRGRPIPKNHNNHPTVKPNSLMRYLCRLVTPPGGLILDNFCGSGSTGKAAIQEGFKFIGIDKDASSVEIAKKRCEAVILPIFQEAL